MASFEEIDGARRLLGLGEAATLKEIKQAYRKMAFCYHPDRAGEDREREEDVARAYRVDAYMKRYAHGWFDGI